MSKKGISDKGVSAVIATILMLMITIALAGMAYMYISGIFTAKTGIVIEMDETATNCVSGALINVRVRNTGTVTTTADKISLSGTASDGTAVTTTTTSTVIGLTVGNCGLSTDTITAGGGSFLCKTTLKGKRGTNTIVVAGPTNTGRGTVYCASD